MLGQKLVYVAPDTHRRLKLLAARRNRTMGEMVGQLVDEELTDLSNVWTSAEGLKLQERMLAKAWADPALSASALMKNDRFVLV